LLQNRDDTKKIPFTSTVNEHGLHLATEAPNERPRRDIGTCNENDVTGRGKHDDIEVAEMVGHEEERAAWLGPQLLDS